jgi:hypothetical protein
MDGSDGLEPATSGVTGHFQGRDVHDVGLRIAVFMRFVCADSRRTRMVEPTECGRLLPDCCPGTAVLRLQSGPSFGL